MFVLMLIWLADGLNILLPYRLGKSLQFGSVAVSVSIAIGVLYYRLFGNSKRYIVIAVLVALESLAFSVIEHHTIYQSQ